MAEKFLGVNEAAAELRKHGISVTPETVRVWCRRGLGIRFTPGGRFHIPLSRLLRHVIGASGDTVST